MTDGYVGQKAKKRARKKNFFLIIFILIVFLIYISIQEINVEVSDEEIVKVEEENIQFEDQSSQLKKLEIIITEYKQKLQLRDQLIKSLKDQTKALEKSNYELIESIKIKNLEKNQSNINLENIQQRITKLKKEAQKQNNIILLFEEKNMELNSKTIDFNNKILMLNNKIQMLNININEIILQNNVLASQVENLNDNIIEKDQIIENLKDKIHH